MTEQMYEIAVTATAEVRDKDGNLISSEPIESTVVVGEAQATAIVEAMSAPAEETSRS